MPYVKRDLTIAAKPTVLEEDECTLTPELKEWVAKNQHRKIIVNGRLETDCEFVKRGRTKKNAEAAAAAKK
jgi:hypothetical protein